MKVVPTMLTLPCNLPVPMGYRADNSPVKAASKNVGRGETSASGLRDSASWDLMLTLSLVLKPMGVARSVAVVGLVVLGVEPGLSGVDPAGEGVAAVGDLESLEFAGIESGLDDGSGVGAGVVVAVGDLPDSFWAATWF